jgi:endo-1,4-beta-xylanase
VEVVDAQGRPALGAQVEVEQLTHAFRFGTAVVPKRFVADDADSAAYRAKFLALFNGAVPENQLKWAALAGDFGPENADFETTAAGLRWARAQGAEVRGHVLVWPSWQNSPKSLRALEPAPPALREAIRAHIASTGARSAELTDEWDVVNEPYTNHDFMDIFGNEVMVEWFKAAATALPGQRLYLNDYGILSGGGLNRAKQDAYFNTAKYLLDRGAPLSGLGLQGHFGSALTPPERLLEILDRMATLGLPLRVTEFDVDMADEQVQADYTRDFYLTLFSHPAVDGIYTWGFWASHHWLPRAAYFTADWTERPNGRALRELLRERWWTRHRAPVGERGELALRAFAGSQRVRAILGTREVEATVEVVAQETARLRLVLPAE